jgi:hypothetical protein
MRPRRCHPFMLKPRDHAGGTPLRRASPAARSSFAPRPLGLASVTAAVRAGAEAEPSASTRHNSSGKATVSAGLGARAMSMTEALGLP